MFDFHTDQFAEGITTRVVQDDDPMNPRKDCDPFGHMICFHSRYDLGDDHNYGDPTNFALQLYRDLDGDDYSPERLYRQPGESWATCQDISSYELVARFEADPDRLWSKLDDLAIILPLYLYDHGGITMSASPFSCGWDSGRVGYIYISLAEIRHEFACKRITKDIRARATKTLTACVEEYDLYLTGQGCGYIIEDADGEHLDSCWGYLGADSCRDEAKHVAKFHVVKARKDRLTREIAKIKANAYRLRRSLTMTDTLADFGRLHSPAGAGGVS